MSQRSFTSPTDDIIVQDGTFAFDYDARGYIKAGQGVIACSTLGAMIASGTGGLLASGCIGVAAYTTSDPNGIAVYGPGNVVRVVCSGGCSAGDLLFCLTPDGKFGKPSAVGAEEGIQAASSGGVSAIALETKGTNGDTVRVLLR